MLGATQLALDRRAQPLAKLFARKRSRKRTFDRCRMSDASQDTSASAPAALADAKDRENVGDSVMYDVDPTRWGPTFWSTFHLIAYAYPEEPERHTQEAAFRFFDSMRFLVPCSECRTGYRERWHMFDLRDHLHTRSALIEWVITVHDSVNEKLGAAPLDYAAFMQTLLGENVVAEDKDNESAASAKREHGAIDEQTTKKGAKRTQSVDRSTQTRTARRDARRGLEHARRLQLEQERQVRAAPQKGRLQSYHAARFAMQSRAQSMRYQSKSVASRVQAPRECENCNRKNFVPSVFS